VDGVKRAKERSGDETVRSASNGRGRVAGVLLGALLLGTLSACGGGVPPTAVPPSAPTQAATRLATTPLSGTAPACVAVTPVMTARPSGTAPACAAVPSGPATATVTVPRAATPSASATRGTMDYPDVVRAAIAQATTDLGVAPDQLTIVAVEARDWPDSSLGCPQPGRAYAQIVTPGYRLVVQATGRQYDYHTNRTTMIVRCTP